MRLLLAAVVVAGCTLPRAERPLGTSVNLIVEDARPAARTAEADFLTPVLIYVLPLVPWIDLRDDPLPQRSLAPELERALEDTGLFTQVLGPGDPWPERLAAPYTLRVVLVESEVHLRRTPYALGVVGLLLHVLGAPQDYESVSIALRATCTASDGRVVCEGDGSDRALGLTWIYEHAWSAAEREAHLRHAVRVALGEALAELLEPE